LRRICAEGITASKANNPRGPNVAQGDDEKDYSREGAERETCRTNETGIEHFGAHDLRRTCAKFCRRTGGDSKLIKFLLLGIALSTTDRYLGSEQHLAVALNDNLGL
jgi:integrase